MLYPISEIFSSIQGEGVLMGMPATFIRFAGCNLACDFCDTDFSVKQELTEEEIFASIQHPLIVLTGGEPTLYPDIQNLIAYLFDYAIIPFQIAVETNGSLAPEWITDHSLHVTCSPKKQADYFIHPDLKPYISELKFVVTPDFKFSDIKDLISWFDGPVWFQPEASNYKENIKHCYDMVMHEVTKNNLRVGCQLHKIIGVE